MKWGDELIRGQIETTLAVLREGQDEFRELAASDDAKLVEKLAKLDPDRLRSIVFERVMADRYQPREEAVGEN
jgi:hypothetical protein